MPFVMDGVFNRLRDIKLARDMTDGESLFFLLLLLLLILPIIIIIIRFSQPFSSSSCFHSSVPTLSQLLSLFSSLLLSANSHVLCQT